MEHFLHYRSFFEVGVMAKLLNPSPTISGIPNWCEFYPFEEIHLLIKVLRSHVAKVSSAMCASLNTNGEFELTGAEISNAQKVSTSVCITVTI